MKRKLAFDLLDEKVLPSTVLPGDPPEFPPIVIDPNDPSLQPSIPGFDPSDPSLQPVIPGNGGGIIFPPLVIDPNDPSLQPSIPEPGSGSGLGGGGGVDW